MTLKTSTRCVQFDTEADPFGALAPPIYQTATFQQPAASEFGEYDYTRSGNPTRSLLEAQLARLEDGKYACAFASGMAAITALTRLLTTGQEIIAGDDLYGGTVRLLDQILPRAGIVVQYVDTSDLDAVANALSPQTKFILIETPSNPLLRISDIRQLSKLAHTVGAHLAVDNSMMSPVLQQPLRLGADVVIHSATKFLCGHSDVMAGALIVNNRSLHQQLAFQQNAEGAGLSPFESWLLFRGMKTLALRVERQDDTARRVAQFLKSHPLVEKVYHPSLADHPGQGIHRTQSEGDGAIVSFTTGDAGFSARLAEATQLFKIAVSFGSVGSTVSLPFHMSHASIPARLKARLAPPGHLVRLSVGIEDADDLIADLEQALAVAANHTTQTQELKAEVATV